MIACPGCGLLVALGICPPYRPPNMRCTIRPVFEETPMPLGTPRWHDCAVDDHAPTPTVVTYWLELTRLTDDLATFASDQHPGELRMAKAEWLNLDRPGRIESRMTAR